MPNFVNRNLSGHYRATVANSVADYRKIAAMFLEIARDLETFENQLADLEAAGLGTVTASNFEENSLDGNILLENSVPGSKLADNSITGSKVISNSANGLTDSNIAADAGIAISKVDLSGLSHNDLLGIGANTHAQIDSMITDIQTMASGTTSQLNSLTSEVSTMSSFIFPVQLTTAAATVGPAINELKAGMDAISREGIDYLNRVPVDAVTSASYTEPPYISGNPDVSGILDGARYIPALPAAGDWSGHGGQFAIFTSGDPSTWNYEVPAAKTIAWINDEGLYRQYLDGSWSVYIPISSVFTEHLNLDADSALPTVGSSYIPSGANHIGVAADISPISRVFLTQTGTNTDGLRLKVKSQVESSGFEVYTKPETSTTSDLYFNWMLVN